MLRPRIIPTLLLKGLGLVKGKQFKDHRYIGDPMNAVSIFNTKEVDEILFLDITATSENRIPSPEFIQKIADSCLVPFAVGGGIRNVDDARIILKSGAEKVCLNTAALLNPKVIQNISQEFGNQSIVVSIDVKKNFFGKVEVYTNCGMKKFGKPLFETIDETLSMGAGEIIINNIDRDGMLNGYDLQLLEEISNKINVPLIASGGAGSLADLKEGLNKGCADAVAAGSLFVFHGKRQAVLISYPDENEMKSIYN